MKTLFLIMMLGLTVSWMAGSSVLKIAKVRRTPGKRSPKLLSILPLIILFGFTSLPAHFIDGLGLSRISGVFKVSSAEAAVAYRSSSAVVGVNTGPMDLAMPAGTVQNDIMIAVIVAEELETVSVPAGWTRFIEVNSGATLRTTVAWKRAGASEAGPYSFDTVSSSGPMLGAIASFSGALTSGSPIDVSNSQANASSLTITAPAITPTVVDTMVVFAVGFGLQDSNIASYSGPNPTFTEAFDGNTNKGSGYTVSLAYGTKNDMASTGSRTATATDAAAVNVGGLFAIAPQTGGDSTPPDPVADLTVVGTTSSDADLEWTAPGDDGAVGTATSYDIRYSTSCPLLEAGWAAATQATGEPAPKVAGSLETFTVTGLLASTSYCFAIKTSDEVPNESTISNSAAGTTTAGGTPGDQHNVAFGLDQGVGTQTTNPAPNLIFSQVPAGSGSDDVPLWILPGVTNPESSFRPKFIMESNLTTVKVGSQYSMAFATCASPNSLRRVTGGAPTGCNDANWDTTTNTDFTGVVGAQGSGGTWRLWDSTIMTGGQDLLWYPIALAHSGSGATGDITMMVEGTGALNYDTSAAGITGRGSQRYALEFNGTQPAGSAFDVYKFLQREDGTLAGRAAMGDHEITGGEVFVLGTDYGTVFKAWPLATGTNSGTWTTPTNVENSDNSYATAAAGNHQYGTWGLGIPASAIIDIVAVGVEVFSDVTNQPPVNVSVSWDGGTTWSASPHVMDRNVTPEDRGVDLHILNPADVTGDVAWTPTMLNDANFLVRVEHANGNVSVDRIVTEVLYHCVGGCAVATTIGDGVGSSSKGVLQSSTNNSADSFTLSTSTGADTLTSLTVTFSGTNVSDVVNPNGVKLYRDNNSDGEYDGGDTFIAQTSFSGVTATFAGLSEGITTTAVNYIITYDITAGATLGNTLQGAVTAASVTNPLTNNDSVDGTLTVTNDIVPPAAIADLTVVGTTSSEADLEWTAPGDDGSTGTATSYDVRYSTSCPLLEAGWAAATPATGEPAPQIAGSLEAFTVTGLLASTSYCFAVKTSDEVPNESTISNSAPGTTTAAGATGDQHNVAWGIDSAVGGTTSPAPNLIFSEVPAANGSDDVPLWILPGVTNPESSFSPKFIFQGNLTTVKVGSQYSMAFATCASPNSLRRVAGGAPTGCNDANWDTTVNTDFIGVVDVQGGGGTWRLWDSTIMTPGQDVLSYPIALAHSAPGDVTMKVEGTGALNYDTSAGGITGRGSQRYALEFNGTQPAGAAFDVYKFLMREDGTVVGRAAMGLHEVTGGEVFVLGTDYGTVFKAWPSGTGTHSGTWSTPTNVENSDDSYATASSGNHEYGTWGLGIPAGAIIDIVAVGVEAFSDVTNQPPVNVSVSWDGGTTWSASPHVMDRNVTPDDLGVDLDILNPADVTGDVAWTDTMLNDANFVVRVEHSNGNVSLDRVVVEVLYHCVGGCAATTIGDGTSPANKSVSSGSTNNAVDAFTLSTDTGADTLTSLTVTFSGTDVNDVAASGVKLYRDENSDSEWDAGDTQIGAAVSFSGATATIGSLSEGITTTAVDYIITYDIDAGAGGGNTLQGSVTAASVTNSLTNNDTVDATLTVSVTPTTSLGDGTDPGNSTVAPGSGITDLDAFTFQTNSGTDTITDLTVTLAAGTAAGLSEIRITNAGGGTTYYTAVSNPGSDTIVFSGGTSITATTTLTQYKVRITPKSHAAMPAPAGSEYAVTGTVTAWTGSLAQAGTDTDSATVTIDNLSPSDVTGASGTASDAQVDLSWTDPGDGDLDSIVILRRAGAAVGDTPVEGTTYIVGNTIGASTVACVEAAGSGACTDSGLTNGTAYHYKIFAKDSRGNYSTPGVVPTGSPFTPAVTTTIGDGTAPSDKTVAQSSTDNAVAAFTLSTSSGGDTLTSLTVTFTGSDVNDVAASGVKLYRDENSDNEWDAGDTQIGAAVSFSGATATIGGLSEGITTTPVDYIITYDIDAGATASNTLQGAVSAASVTNNLTNNDNVDATLTVGALVVDDGRIVYGESTPTPAMPNTRLFDDSGGSPAFSGTEDDTVSGTAPVVVRNRANGYRDEHIAGYVDSLGTLQVMRYNGLTATWSNEWTAAVGGNGTTGRRFDIAFEENTGRGIVVYSTNTPTTNEMAYRIWDGTSWAGPFNIDPTRTSGTILWVKLEARPNANDMGLIFSDSNNDLSGLTWDGTSWANEPGAAFSTNLENAGTIGGTEAFDLTFEMQSGELMVAWGDLGANGFNYSVFNGASWAGGFVDMADDTTYLDMSSDPSTDQIVLAQMAADRDDLAAAVWNGSAWTVSQNIDGGPNTPVANQKFLATGWLVSGATSRAVIVYGAGSTSVDWVTWNGTFTGTDFTIQTSWAPTPAFSFLGERWIDIVMDPINQDQLMVTLSDGANDLFAKRLTMSAGPSYAWTNEENGGTAMELNLNSVAAQNFSFDYDRVTTKVILGDGTAPADKSAVTGSTNNAASAFTLSTNTGADTVTEIQVSFSGTDVNDVPANGVKIFQDNGTVPNEWDASDTQIGTAQSFVANVATFSGLSVSVSPSAVQYIVTYDIDAGATASNTLRGSVTSATATGRVINNDTLDATLTVVSTPSTTLGDGVNPASATVAPGSGIADLDSFTFQTNIGTDTITDLTVTLAAGTAAGLSEIRITNDGGGTTYYNAVSNPGSDTIVFSGGTNITATTTLTQYKVRITPKTHAAMPAPAGSNYAVTGTVTAWTGTLAQLGSDAASATINVDNLSPGDVTGASATAGPSKVDLAWTDPGDGDLDSIVVLRRANNPVGDTPVEGTTYIVGNTIGASTVACAEAAGSGACTDSPLSDGTPYHYKIFAKDSRGNYSTPGVVPSGSPATPNTYTTLGNGTDPATVTVAPGSGIIDLDSFTFQTNAGTDTLTDLTVTLAAGTAAGLSEIRITNDGGGTTYYNAVSNPGSDTIVFSGGTNITATTTLTQYKVRITPKSHAAMPAPAGSEYAVSGTVTAWTGTNVQQGSDSGSATITVDNLSPGNVTGATAGAGDTEVVLAWTEPGDADRHSVIVLQRAGAAVGDTPVEGTIYSVSDTIGSSTVVCVEATVSTGCTSSGLTNGTAYHYRIFVRDTNGNYSASGVVPTGSPATPAATTSIANGTDPGNVTIAPGGPITDLDSFTFATSTGVDSITQLEVTLAAGTSSRLSEVRITNDGGGTTYFTAVSNPGSDVISFTGGTPIPVTTSATQFKIRITPKSHAAMPAPPGAEYAVTGTVTDWTGSNTNHLGSDAGSATITIDNLSPGNVSGTGGSPGDGQVTLTWTDPGDGDLDSIVVLRRAGSAVADVPVEGVTYIVGNTIGTATVGCVTAAGVGTCTDTGLTNGTDYHYEIFAKDSNGNYAIGVVPAGSPFTPNPVTVVGDFLGSATSNKNVIFGATDQAVNAFTLRTTSGSDSVTEIIVDLDGTVPPGGDPNNVAANGVKLYLDGGGTIGEWDAGDTQIGNAVSFVGGLATFNAGAGFPISVTTTETRYIITYDIDAAAVSLDTLQGSVTSVTASNFVDNQDQADATLTIGVLIDDNGRIFYGESTPTATMPNIRVFDDPLFNAVEDDTVSGTAPVVVVDRAATTRDEHLAGYVDSAGTLEVLRYTNPGGWFSELSTPVGGNGTNGRRFDIAYEGVSGKALLVASNGVPTTNEMAYGIWDGTSWTGPINLDPTTVDGTVLWVKLAASPASNQIALIFSDSNNNLSAMVWNGSTFANETNLAAASLQVVGAAGDIDPFDVTVESQTGGILVAWAPGGASDINYATFSGGSWSAPAAVGTGTTTFRSLDLSSDPLTDQILLAGIGTGGALGRGVWNGSAWGNTGNDAVAAQTAVAGERLVSTGWLNSSAAKRGVVVFRDSGDSNVHYLTFNGSAFSGELTFVPNPASAAMKQLEIDVDPINLDRLILSYSDSASDLWTKKLTMNYTGALTWTDAEAGAVALETDLNTVLAQNFSFAFDRFALYVPAPTGFSASTDFFNPNTQINLTWTDNASSEVTYTVQSGLLTDSTCDDVGEVYTQVSAANLPVPGENPIGWPKYSASPSAIGGSVNAANTNLTPGTSYCYRIRANALTASSDWVYAGATTGGGADVTAPAAVTDLAVFSVTQTSASLVWTAPGDDGNAGTATSYDIRWALGACPLTWGTANTVTGEPAPQLAGTLQAYTVTGLSASNTYCFAIRTSDEIPNESSDSNFADGTTSGADGVAPAQILDLTIITGGQRPDSIDLTWTAPSDNVRAVRYDIRYSLLPIGDPAGAGENDWSTLCTDVLTPTLNAKRPNDCVVPVVNLAPPIPAGFTEVRTIRGRINPSASPAFACDVADHDPSHEPCLVPNTTYYFAVKTEDSVPNSSTVSVSIGGDNPTDGSLGGRTALRKGFNLVAVPRALAGPDDTPVAVFDDDLGGTLNLQKWLSSGPSFTEGCYAASPSSGSDCVPQVDIPLVISGDGYFLSANGGNEVIDAPGTSASVTPGTNCGVGSSYQVAVSLGWNIVGDPFEKPVDLTNVMVCKGGSATAWNTAVGNGEVAAAMYSYDGSGYVAQTPTASPPALLGLFEPWKGYYIQVLDAAVTHLIFPQPP